MLSAPYSIQASELWPLVGTACAPLLIDARRRDAYDAAPGLLPAAVWRDPATAADWPLDPGRTVVVACQEGHERSQIAGAGGDARILVGGYKAWTEAGLPLVAKAALDRFVASRPSVWVTRRLPKIDRVACPWLTRRFIDADATLLYVDPPEVAKVAAEAGGAPYDIDGVELTHDGPSCSFDTMLKLFGLESDPALSRLALIVRGADTARLDLVPEAAGFLAVSLGLSTLHGDDDHGMIAAGFGVYDALYAWLRFAAAERHNWPAKAA